MIASKSERAAIGQEVSINSPFYRPESILQKLEEREVDLNSFLRMPLLARLDLLSPDSQRVAQTIEQGNLATLFPSIGRLYRVFGRLPSASEICWELNDGGFVEKVTVEEVKTWLGYSETFLGLFRPEVEEYALHRWRTERRFRIDVDPYEFINESHVWLREIFIFYQDWDNWEDYDDVGGYLFAGLKHLLTTFSHWLNVLYPETVSLDDWERSVPYQRLAGSSEDYVLDRQARKEIMTVLKEAVGEIDVREQKAIFYLFGETTQEELEVASKEELTALINQALKSLATVAGVRLNREILFFAGLTPREPGPPLVTKQRYSKKYPPFVVNETSVFANLPIEMVYYVISRLSLPEQFLVLAYLGYFPFENQSELAKELGYDSRWGMARKRGINQLTGKLVTVIVATQALKNVPDNASSLKEILNQVKRAKKSGKLKKTKGKGIGRGVQKEYRRGRGSPRRQSLARLNLDDSTNKLVYEHLTDRQREFFDLLTLKDSETDSFVWSSISSLARHLGISPKTLSNQMAVIAAKFEKEIVVGESQLRKRAEALQSHPGFLDSTSRFLGSSVTI